MFVRQLVLVSTLFALLIASVGCDDLNRRSNFNDLIDKQASKGNFTALRKRLKSSNWRRQLGAVQALKALGPKGTPAIPDLLGLMERARHFKVRYAIVNAFQAMGKPAVVELIKGLGTKNKRTQLSIIWALGKIGPDAAMAVPHLIPFLNSTFRDTRRATLHSLGQIGPAAKEALPAVIRIAKTGEGKDRVQAISTLGSLGRSALVTLPMLKTMALNKAEAMYFRNIAVRSLGRLFNYDRSRELMLLLVKLAEHPKQELQLTAIDMVGRAGYKGPEVMKLLERLSKDKRRSIRRSVGWARQRLRGRRKSLKLRENATPPQKVRAAPQPARPTPKAAKRPVQKATSRPTKRTAATK